MSDSPAAAAHENGSDDERDEEQQVTNVNQKKEDAKVEKELDRVTDRVDEEEIGSENIGNVNRFFFLSRLIDEDFFFIGFIGH